MKVKIGNTIVDSEKEPVLVLLSPEDKRRIADMSPFEFKYASFPDGVPIQDIVKFMKTDVSAMDGIKFDVIPEFADHMPIEQWLDAVEHGAFVDYDGHGRLCTATQESDIEISPSHITDDGLTPPDWVTHVAWYNK